MNSKRITMCRLPYHTIMGILKSAYPLWAGYLYSSVEDLKGKGLEISFVDGETFRFHGKHILHSDFANRFLEFFFPRLLRSNKELKKFAFSPQTAYWRPFIDEIKQTKPDVVAVSAYSSDFAALRTFSKIIKSELPGCKILLGGIHVTVDYENVAKLIPEIDYFCIGEGEAVFREFAISFISEKDVSDIPGIYSTSAPAKFRPRQLVASLDDIKMPYRFLKPMELYRDEFHVFTSRGCPFRCNFCSSHKLWDRKTREHSVERVMEEITHIVRDLNGFRIIFIDDTFTLNRKRSTEIMARIKELKFDFLNMHVGTRITNVDHEMLETLAAGGVKSISFGIETGSERIQKLSKKNLKHEDIVDILDYSKKLGMLTLTFYIVGHPDETAEDVDQTIALIKKAKSSKAHVFAMQPLPGTDVYSIAYERGFRITPENALDMDPHIKSAINLTNMSDIELRKKSTEAYNVCNKISFKGRFTQAAKYFLSRFISRLKKRNVNK